MSIHEHHVILDMDNNKYSTYRIVESKYYHQWKEKNQMSQQMVNVQIQQHTFRIFETLSTYKFDALTPWKSISKQNSTMMLVQAT